MMKAVKTWVLIILLIIPTINVLAWLVPSQVKPSTGRKGIEGGMHCYDQ
jgi:hypothetical protein